MLSPPYLELAYYVGASRAKSALSSVLGGAGIRGAHEIELPVAAPGAVGIAEDEEATVEDGVLILRTEGDVFSGPLGKKRAAADTQGLKVKSRFLEAANLVKCAYGAIVVEYSLERPDELKKDPRSLAFKNFYASRLSLGESVIQKIVDLAGEQAYLEVLESGIYVSMSRHFNPERRSVAIEESLDRSARISALIGQTLRS